MGREDSLDSYLQLARRVQRQVQRIVTDIENGEGLHCLIVCGEDSQHGEDPTIRQAKVGDQGV
jgi:hypothetical protein